MNWGNLLQKGKQLAANIDKQLNESVGIEVANEDATTAKTTASSSNVLNDGWNDEFINGDDDDALFDTTPATKLAMEATTTMPETTPTTTPQVTPVAAAATVDQDGWNEDDDALNQFDDEEDGMEDVPLKSAVTTAAEAMSSAEAPKEEEAAPPAQQGESSPPDKVQEALLVEMPVGNSFEPPQQTEPPQTEQDDGGAAQKDGWADDFGEEEPITEEVHEKEEDGDAAAAAAPEEAPDFTAPQIVDESPPPNTRTPAFVEQPQVAVTETRDAPITVDEAAEMVIPDPALAKTIGAAPEAETSGDHVMISSLQLQIQELQQQLGIRESQLQQKVEQMALMQTMFESEKDEFRNKVREVRDEAKRRIQAAKVRVEGNDEKQHQQEQLIAELRAEGENLARKQSEMERAVRAARMETRELNDKVQEETQAKENAIEKITKLEADLKSTKEQLSSARRGESQATKLETDLVAAREQVELKAATILSLEQQVKELKSEGKELRAELDDAKKGAAIETARESKKLRKEHTDVISDLELKLRTVERDAAVREDALRHEVEELRKRWQDAVRRADALSMDVQSSTAPLLRQLESMQRQNRARAAAWAELETSLRSELEENVIENEKLTKERSDHKAKYNRLERIANEREEELKKCRAIIEEQTTKITRLETKLEEIGVESQKQKEEWAEIERLANEGVSRVRSEMTQTVIESEERYRGQIKTLEVDLREEQEKRAQLERQVQEMLDNAGAMIVSTPAGTQAPKESAPVKLRKSEGQAEILAGALDGYDSDEEGLETSTRGFEDLAEIVADSSQSSFAAIEQLTQRLKGAISELTTLRKSLAESERIRSSLVEELADARHASEKLPLFEAKVKELTDDCTEKEMEIQGLREDIAEVRELYRTQLNVLLEEKAASVTNAEGEKPASAAGETDETQKSEVGAQSQMNGASTSVDDEGADTTDNKTD